MKKLLAVPLFLSLVLCAMDQHNNTSILQLSVERDGKVVERMPFNPEEVDIFSYDSFSVGIKESQEKGKPYILGVVKVKTANRVWYHFYHGDGLLKHYADKKTYADIHSTSIVTPGDIVYGELKNNVVHYIASQADVIKNNARARRLPNMAGRDVLIDLNNDTDDEYDAIARLRNCNVNTCMRVGLFSGCICGIIFIGMYVAPYVDDITLYE